MYFHLPHMQYARALGAYDFCIPFFVIQMPSNLGGKSRVM